MLVTVPRLSRLAIAKTEHHIFQMDQPASFPRASIRERLSAADIMPSDSPMPSEQRLPPNDWGKCMMFDARGTPVWLDKNVEIDDDERDVACLDNARLHGQARTEFRTHLSVLAKRGVYQSIAHDAA